VCLSAVVGGCGGEAAESALTFPDPRTAEDCVSFLRTAYRDAGHPYDGVQAAGTPPRLMPEVFWFGPRIGKRRATVAIEEAQVYPGEPRSTCH
jgi:hypothetical protein